LERRIRHRCSSYSNASLWQKTWANDIHSLYGELIHCVCHKSTVNRELIYNASRWNYLFESWNVLAWALVPPNSVIC
jgi:hypothetical protein